MTTRWARLTGRSRSGVGGVGRPAAWAALWAVAMFYLLGTLLWGWWVMVHSTASSLQLPAGQGAVAKEGSQWRVVSLKRVSEPPEEYKPIEGTVLVRAELAIRRSGEELCEPTLTGQDGRHWEQVTDYDLGGGAQRCSDLPAGVEQVVPVLFEVPASEMDAVSGIKFSPSVDVGRQSVLRPPA